MTVAYHRAPVGEIDPKALYAILKLRVDVFVVEQSAAYEELDGRDVEPGALLLWAEDDDGRVLATLRLLHDGGAGDRRIGRVATAASARGSGLAAILLRQALEGCDGQLVRLDAQSHLEGWYGRFGFVRSGDEFLEDDIPHLPMERRAA